MSVNHSAIFSSKLNVALSPSEPGAMIAVQPLSISQRACFATNAWSIFRFSSNAVVVAGITPRQLICIARLLHHHTLNLHGKDRRPDRLRLPTQQKLHRGSANPSLAWSHAAARLQLRRAPRIVHSQ